MKKKFAKTFELALGYIGKGTGSVTKEQKHINTVKQYLLKIIKKQPQKQNKEND